MKVIKVGAVWCPGCHIMNPRWEEVETIYPDLETEYYDYDEYEDMLVEKYKIDDTLPVAIFLDKNNNELERLVGIVTKKEIIKLVEEYHEK